MVLRQTGLIISQLTLTDTPWYCARSSLMRWNVLSEYFKYSNVPVTEVSVLRGWRKLEAYSSPLIQSLLHLLYPIVTTDPIMRQLLQPLRSKCRKFHIKIYVNDLSICDFKLIHYCKKWCNRMCRHTRIRWLTVKSCRSLTGFMVKVGETRLASCGLRTAFITLLKLTL